MPVLNLPDDVMEELKNSQSGQINGTEGAGVAIYLASSSYIRVDIYVGLNLAEFTFYQDISAVYGSIKMLFALNPSVSCQSSVIVVNPDTENTITLQVMVIV